MNEINILAVALTASNSADSLEALKKNFPEQNIEFIEEAVGALRSLSWHLVDQWLDLHPDIEE